MSLERDLHDALRRRNPPAGFDDRVRSRIASANTIRPSRQPSRWRMAAPLAASLLMAFSATYYVQQREQREREQMAAERAAREVTLALQITSDTLAQIRTRVQEMNQHEH